MDGMLIVSFFLFQETLIAEDLSKGVLRKYETESSKYEKANALLNMVKLKTASREKAQTYIRKLEEITTQYPDYPYLAETYYFLGVNCQFAGEWKKAVYAFLTALELKPSLINHTPIQSYLKTAREHYVSDRMPALLRMMIVVLLIFFILAGLYLKSWQRIQFKSVAAWGLCLLLWLAIFAWAAFWDNPDSVSGLESFPRPVLLNTTLLSEGSAPLLSLFGYAFAAFLGSLLILCSCLGFTNRIKGLGISICGVVLFSTCCMTLCYMQTCYMKGEAVTRGSICEWRIHLMVRNISFVNEIPDRMLPLYDEDFRKKSFKNVKNPNEISI